MKTVSIIYYLGTQRLSSMIPLMSPKRNTKFKCGFILLIPPLSFEGRDTRVVPENLHKTPFFSVAYHLTWVNWIKHKKNANGVYREKETDWDTFFLKKILKKKDHSPKKIKKNRENALLPGHRSRVTC